MLSGVAFALDLSFTLKPEVQIPLGEESAFLFSVGGGATVDAGVLLADRAILGATGGIIVLPLRNTGTFATLARGGLGASVLYRPWSRVEVSGGLSGGAYRADFDTLSASNLWWGLDASVGFRFSPGFTLSFGTGYRAYEYPGSPLYEGLLAGISARATVSTKKASGLVSASLAGSQPLFPMLYALYRDVPSGTLEIKNGESAEVTDVTVSFAAKGYSNSARVCGTFSQIPRGKTVSASLLADLSDAILGFTEDGQIPGEVRIEYKLLGKSRSSVTPVVLKVYNRNRMRWGDPAVLAACVSSDSPSILDFSKYLVGIARSSLRPGLIRNMQFAMYAFEGMKTGGIEWRRDTETPYDLTHRDPSLLDYVQFPSQTLSYRSGDSDDLALLYASALEAVGIRAALLPLDNDLVVLLDLGITGKEAATYFDSDANYLVMGDSVWIPVGFSKLREGFVNCWYDAVAQLRDAISSGANLDPVFVEEAWGTYPPVNPGGEDSAFAKPGEKAVKDAVETDLLRYITAEFRPKILALQEQLRAGGDAAGLENRLGLLYVRAGLYPEAEAEFRKSFDLGSAAAAVNLGNVAMLTKRPGEARDWYNRALTLDPGNESARTGLGRALADLGE